MMQDRLRAVLAEEYEKADLHYQAAVVRGEEGGEPSHKAVLAIIFDAMRRVYLMGRDDANADAEPLGEPVDPRFRPTRRDLVHLRMDAEAAGREGFPVKVTLAPAVLYMSWPNSRHDPGDEESTPYHCISFHIPKPE